MKKLVVAFILMFGCTFVVIAETKVVPEGEDNYPQFVDGLKQYLQKNPTPIPDSYNTATNVSMTRWDDCVEMTFVTVDGQMQTVKLLGKDNDITLAIYLHEWSPDVGKYIFWKPVLHVPRKKDGAQMYCHEIYMIGRFRSVYDKKNRSKVIGYETETYR